jgi:hypothetical protein
VQDLPTDELRVIWDMADLSGDGKLDAHEYAIIMLLVQARCRSIELPSVLPSSFMSRLRPPLFDSSQCLNGNSDGSPSSVANGCDTHTFNQVTPQFLGPVDNPAHGSVFQSAPVLVREVSSEMSSRFPMPVKKTEPLPSPRQLLLEGNSQDISEEQQILEWANKLNPSPCVTEPASLLPSGYKNEQEDSPSEGNHAVAVTATEWTSFDDISDDVLATPKGQDSMPLDAVNSSKEVDPFADVISKTSSSPTQEGRTERTMKPQGGAAEFLAPVDVFQNSAACSTFPTPTLPNICAQDAELISFHDTGAQFFDPKQKSFQPLLLPDEPEVIDNFASASQQGSIPPIVQPMKGAISGAQLTSAASAPPIVSLILQQPTLDNTSMKIRSPAQFSSSAAPVGMQSDWSQNVAQCFSASFDPMVQTNSQSQPPMFPFQQSPSHGRPPLPARPNHLKEATKAPRDKLNAERPTRPPPPPPPRKSAPPIAASCAVTNTFFELETISSYDSAVSSSPSILDVTSSAFQPVPGESVPSTASHAKSCVPTPLWFPGETPRNANLEREKAVKDHTLSLKCDADAGHAGESSSLRFLRENLESLEKQLDLSEGMQEELKSDRGDMRQKLKDIKSIEDDIARLTSEYERLCRDKAIQEQDVEKEKRQKVAVQKENACAKKMIVPKSSSMEKRRGNPKTMAKYEAQNMHENKHGQQRRAEQSQTKLMGRVGRDVSKKQRSAQEGALRGKNIAVHKSISKTMSLKTSSTPSNTSNEHLRDDSESIENRSSLISSKFKSVGNLEAMVMPMEISLVPLESKIRELVRMGVKNSLGTDVEAVHIQNLNKGVVQFEVCIVSRIQDVAKSSDSVQDKFDFSDALKQIVFPCHVENIQRKDLLNTSAADKRVDGLTRSLSTDSFFSPRRNETRTCFANTTDSIHKRVVDMVKQKAKQEMAQLEQELLAVIHAMERASLNDSIGLAIAQGAISPDDLQRVREEVQEQEHSLKLSLSPEDLNKLSPTLAHRSVTEPFLLEQSREQQEIAAPHKNLELGEESIQMQRERFFSAHEMNIESVRSERERFYTAGEGEQNLQELGNTLLQINVKADDAKGEKARDGGKELEVVERPRFSSSEVNWSVGEKQVSAKDLRTATSSSDMSLQEFINFSESLQKATSHDQATLIGGLHRHKAHLAAALGGCKALLKLTPSAEGEELERLQGQPDWQAIKCEMQNRYCILGALGVTEAMIEILKMHMTSTEVASTASRILLLLARNDDNKSCIVQKNGIEVIAKTMKRHAAIPTVQEYCCGALRNLALNNVDHCVAIADANGVGLLVTAVQLHFESCRIVQQACCALKILSACTELREEIARSGVLPLLVDAMQAHADNPRVQQHTSAVLLALEDHVEKIAKEHLKTIPRNFDSWSDSWISQNRAPRDSNSISGSLSNQSVPTNLNVEFSSNPEDATMLPSEWRAFSQNSDILDSDIEAKERKTEANVREDIKMKEAPIIQSNDVAPLAIADNHATPCVHLTPKNANQFQRKTSPWQSMQSLWDDEGAVEKVGEKVHEEPETAEKATESELPVEKELAKPLLGEGSVSSDWSPESLRSISASAHVGTRLEKETAFEKESVKEVDKCCVHDPSLSTTAPSSAMWKAETASHHKPETSIQGSPEGAGVEGEKLRIEDMLCHVLFSDTTECETKSSELLMSMTVFLEQLLSSVSPLRYVSLSSFPSIMNGNTAHLCTRRQTHDIYTFL